MKEIKKFKYLKDFKVGSSSSGPQSEGVKGKYELSTWDHWFKIDKDKFWGKIGPEDTNNLIENYKEYVKCLKQSGHNSFRLSFQWTRVYKDIENEELNKEGIEFYHNFLDELIKNGIEPIVNLFHFDMPIKLQEKYGGWTSKTTVDLYRKYAKKMFEIFGDKVKTWFTFNEPIVHVECQYLLGFHYPAEYNPEKAMISTYNTILASAYAISEYKKMNLKGEIGIILNLSPVYPRSNDQKDLEAAKNWEALFSKSFLDPAITGELNKTWLEIISKEKFNIDIREDELEIIKENTIDILGVNYYQPARVKASETNDDSFLTKYFESFKKEDIRINPYRGWEIYPQALLDIGIQIKNEYNNIKWMVMENGMGVEDESRFKEKDMINDDYRIDFFEEHLYFLEKAIEEGSNCKGFHIWTGIDNWSWLNSFKNRYGIFEYNLETKTIHPKKSSLWFKEKFVE